MTRSYYQKTELKKQQTKTQNEFFSLLKEKPFYIWDREAHAKEYDNTKALYGSPRCCFNHIIYLPRKNGVPLGLFDYEQEIFAAYQHYKHVWIKKARGLGVTELTLRYIVWKCFESDAWKDKQACIVTGPRINLATTLVDRIRKQLLPDMQFNTRETMIELNECKIEAYPSHNIDAMRGLTDVSFILIDEGDYFPPGQQQEVRAVAEGYIVKSKPHIVMVSTPNRPEGLFEQIEREENSIYHKIFLHYTIGLGKIYTEEEIAKARESPSFEREFGLQYIGQEGDVFTDESIQAVINNEMLLKEQLQPWLRNIDFVDPAYEKSMGVDPGGGSSRFAISVVQYVPGKGDINPMLQAAFAEEYNRPNYDDMIARIIDMKKNWNIGKIFCDAANPPVIRAIKAGIGERTDFERQIARLKEVHRHVRDDPIKHLPRFMDVIPVPFNSEGRSMLSRTKIMLDRQWLAIDPNKYHKLIVALRTAVGTDGLLDKQSTSHDDLLDAFRLSLLRWDIE
jgi:hypothetical protein